MPRPIQASGFPVETALEVLGFQQAGQRGLDRHHVVQFAVEGEVHRAHAAPLGPLDFVPAGHHLAFPPQTVPARVLGRGPFSPEAIQELDQFTRVLVIRVDFQGAFGVLEGVVNQVQF